MNEQNLVHLLLQYRYWIMIPLSLIEGPVVAFVAGTLAAAGYFNIYALGVYFFTRDMVMDTLFYAFGYFGNRFVIVDILSIHSFLRVTTYEFRKQELLSRVFYKLGISRRIELLFYLTLRSQGCVRADPFPQTIGGQD